MLSVLYSRRTDIFPHLTFFCIVIWKANRAKSKGALRLIDKDPRKRSDLDKIVKLLTYSLWQASSSKRLLQILIEQWGFHLPMAAAILTVLYPKYFTIYDPRVCGGLDEYSDLINRILIRSVWQGYREFCVPVKNSINRDYSMRDKDRILWAKSFKKQLENDITGQFLKSEPYPEV